MSIVDAKPWARSDKGMIAGVCQGLADRFEIDVVMARLLWVFSILFFGVGLGFYFLLAISLPRFDKLDQVTEPRILGVCSRFAKRFDLDVGLTRLGFCIMLCFSGGTFFLLYLLLNFILPKEMQTMTDKKAQS